MVGVTKSDGRGSEENSSCDGCSLFVTTGVAQGSFFLLLLMLAYTGGASRAAVLSPHGSENPVVPTSYNNQFMI